MCVLVDAGACNGQFVHYDYMIGEHHATLHSHERKTLSACAQCGKLVGSTAGQASHQSIGTSQ